MSTCPRLTDAEIAAIRDIWHANPTAGRDRIATLATERIGRDVSPKAVENHKPITLKKRRVVCVPRTDRGNRPGPQPKQDRRPKADRGLPYNSPLDAMILEAKRIRRRLGIGRRKSA